VDGVVWTINERSNFDETTKFRCTHTKYNIAVGDLVQPGYHDGWIMSNSLLEAGESWSALM